MTQRSQLSNSLMTLWFQSPMVMAMRINEMWLSAMTGGAPDARELNRMVTEKMMAGAESAMAVNLAIMRQGFAAATALASGGRASSQHASEAIANAAIKPFSKRVRSNAHRLSRQKG